MAVVLALVLGLVAGLRAFTPLAVVAWAARVGALPLAATPLAFFGYAASPWIFSVLALLEIVNDKLPKTPSRKVPAQFGARIVCGGLAGAAAGAAGHALLLGLLAGVLGSIAGTLGGAAARGRLAAAFGQDLPAALLEDLAAVALAIAGVVVLR